MYKGYTLKHVIHEQGHQLGLPHIFCDEKDQNCQEVIINKNRSIEKGKAPYNYMDYLDVNEAHKDSRNMFFDYQRREVRNLNIEE